MSHNHYKGNYHKIRNSKKYLLKSLVHALIKYESINVTLCRAKALRMVVEPLITRAKRYLLQDKDLASYRILLSAMHNNKDLIDKLVRDIAPRYLAVPGGYVSIIKTHMRMSDGCKMAQVTLWKKAS
jgi:large subunit ribosomal protein L17